LRSRNSWLHLLPRFLRVCSEQVQPKLLSDDIYLIMLLRARRAGAGTGLLRPQLQVDHALMVSLAQTRVHQPISGENPVRWETAGWHRALDARDPVTNLLVSVACAQNQAPKRIQ
jgi:hypothetical protein